MIAIPFRREGERGEGVKVAISCNNWREDFPYSPEVAAELKHDGKNLYLTFFVKEDHIAATARNDNEKVCNDSCVEFFIAFDDNGYYNIEANCAGKILMSHRKARKEDVNYANPEILTAIQRYSSLGNEPFECRKAEGEWQLRLTIPASAFFKHHFEVLSGLKATFNLYKCGDKLPEPHYLSLSPIATAAPDFHQPAYFTPVSFE